jgi:hypothetical protein
MWKIGTVASVTEGWGFNVTDGRAGRSLRSHMRHTAKPWWPRGMLRRPLKKHSRSIQCAAVTDVPRVLELISKRGGGNETVGSVDVVGNCHNCCGSD